MVKSTKCLQITGLGKDHQNLNNRRIKVYHTASGLGMWTMSERSFPNHFEILKLDKLKSKLNKLKAKLKASGFQGKFQLKKIVATTFTWASQ